MRENHFCLVWPRFSRDRSWAFKPGTSSTQPVRRFAQKIGNVIGDSSRQRSKEKNSFLRQSALVLLTSLNLPSKKRILGVIRQSQKYEPKLLLKAWQRFEKEGIGGDRNLTVQEFGGEIPGSTEARRRSTRTIIDNRSRLNAVTKVLGHLRAGAVKRVDILRYMEGIAPGTNRRIQYKTLRKLWRWAHDLGHLANNPMAKVKALDNWGVNNEVLSPELFQRFLRFVQGPRRRRADDTRGTSAGD